jgi:ATP-dependent protease ClpP protease subunit
MPYPSEHAARLRDPGDFESDSFRRQNIADGIDIIIGHLKGETTMTNQAYRFDAEKFTEKQAKDWLKEHDIEYISFEPSSGSVAEDSATLKIYGDIGEDMAGGMFFDSPADTISAKMVSDFLDEHKNAKTIIVRINSRGGDVQEGWAIHDLLTTSGKKIKTIGEGKIYSIATIIFLAGSEREIFRNADGLIHNPFIPPYTLADQYESGDLVKIAESLVQEEEKILDFYAERTGHPRDKLAELMKNETKLSAEDMLTLGFATRIIEPVRAFAYMKPLNIYNQMDEQHKKAFFERLGNVLESAIAKAFGSRLPDPTNMELTDTSGNKFTVEKESGDPAVGDPAKPDGTYVMENGNTIVVTGGKIESITPAESTEDTNPELTEAKKKSTV